MLLMASTNATNIQKVERREEFPLDVFRYLEAKLQRIRGILMNRAADIAFIEDKDEEAYRITKIHVDKALGEFLDDPAKARQELGLQKTRPIKD
jgi:hypothetical protein